MTQISRPRGAKRSKKQSFFTANKIIALASFALMVIFAFTTIISYTFLSSSNDDINLENPGAHKNGILKLIQSSRRINRKHRTNREGIDSSKERRGHFEEEIGGNSNSGDEVGIKPKKLRGEQFDDEGDIESDYDILRAKYDQMLPSETEEDTQRLYDFVADLRKPMHRLHPKLTTDLPYDVNNCPDEPPDGYPIEWSLVDLLNNWNPNNISESFRPGIYQGLCRFDFTTEFHKAQTYRKAEVPFLLRDDPQILKVVERWNQPDYLSNALGKDKKYHTEYSDSNSLMFFRVGRRKTKRGGVPSDWVPPMSSVKITYDEWVEEASKTEEEMGPDQPHYYFRVNAKGGTDHTLFKELPFFLPNKNFYIVNAEDTRGINCRFGMFGNTAAAHFDSSRNFVMLFGGERRYILSHPKNCQNLALFPRSHPSGRHTATDWSDPDLELYPDFAHATANEVVLQAGDALYLPTHWFHHIISLDLNWQCNARSGVTGNYAHHIDKCGF